MRMSHNQAEYFSPILTSSLTRASSLKLQSNVRVHLADRSWYDGRQAANHVCYLELEYHAAPIISARVIFYELSVRVAKH